MGIMGQAMAKNILKAGYELMVYNRTPEKTAPLGEAGARVAVTQNKIADCTQSIVDFIMKGELSPKKVTPLFLSLFIKIGLRERFTFSLF